MFNNMGKKLKALAGIIAGFGIGFSIVYFIVLIKEDLLKVGANTVVLIAVLSLIGAFLIAGFGQLVENSDTLVKLKEAENSCAQKKFGEKQERADDADAKDLKTEENNSQNQKSKNANKVQSALVVSEYLKEKINKISNISKVKKDALESENKDWCEEISELNDKELVKRIDNDQDWQYSYITLCCLEYKRRIKLKKKP